MTQTESKEEPSIFPLLKKAFSNMKVLTGKWYILAPLLLIYVITVVSEPYFYKIFVDTLDQSLKTQSNLATTSTHLAFIAIGWIVLVLISLGSFTYYDFLLNTYANRDWEASMNRTSAHILRLPIDYHLKINIGERQKLVERWNDALWNVAWNMYNMIIPNVLVFISLLILGFAINPILTLVSLSILPVGVLVSATIGARAHAKQKEVGNLWDSVYGRFSDALVNLSLIRILAREPEESTIINARMNAASQAQFSIRKLWCFLSAGGKLLALIGKMTVLIAGVFMILHGTSTLGELFLFVALAWAIYSPLQGLEWSYREMTKSLADYSKLNDVLSMPEEVNEGKIDFPGIRSSIQFQNITFRYPDTTRDVIEDVSFEIPKGKSVAFVGHTGSGKTTLTHLISRFYTPTSWSILVDGVDIRDFSLPSYRSKFAAVFQDTTLFNDTIRHNLGYVREGITEEDIIAACRDANILEFIESLPEGLDTKVGERGLKLSWGEKQRIAIARAILVDPEILILDEATSALDSKTEQLISRAFEKLMQGRTSIVIAHRLSTIRNSDAIYIFRKGKLQSSGTHDELYASNTEYREMVDYQKDGFLRDESLDLSEDVLISE